MKKQRLILFDQDFELSFLPAFFHFKSLFYFDYPSVLEFFNQQYEGLGW